MTYKKIGIAGSRKLACEITEWLCQQKDVEIIGVVVPKFRGWWKEKLEDTARKYNLKIFNQLQDLVDLNPDIIFSINYWKKISSSEMKRVKGGIVNIHHSYLLKYKGRYSTSWAIINARKLNCWEHGTTLHFIDEKLDEGKIIASYKCEIYEEDTAEVLFERVEKIAIQMFKDNFDRIINGKINQYITPANNSYYYDINSNKNLEIPYGIPVEDIYDFVRAWIFKGRPKPFFKYKNKKIYLSLDDD